MTDLEEHFRTLDRLPSPDLWPEAERRRPGRGPMPRRASRLAPAAVALAAAVLGIGLVVRAFAFGPAEGPGAVNPTTSTTPNVTRCTQATTSGDFDGDGTTDTATFIEVASGDVSCDHSGAVVEHLTSQELMVAFGSGQALEQRFTDCQGGLCAYVFAATDLDGDGRDELAVDVSSGGAIGLVEFYRVGLDGARPLTVADPGDPPYVQPGPAIIGGGFDSAAQSPTACRVNADGTRELVSTHAELAGGSVGGQWQVHTTTMVLSGDELAVTSTKDTTSTFSMTSEIFRNGCATGGSGTPTPNPSTSGSAPPPSGSIIYVAHDARGVSVQIQDLSSGSVRTVSRHFDITPCVSPDGQQFVVSNDAEGTGSILLGSTTDWQTSRQLDIPSSTQPKAMGWSADGTKVLFIDNGGRVGEYDVSSDAVSYIARGSRGTRIAVSSPVGPSVAAIIDISETKTELDLLDLSTGSKRVLVSDMSLDAGLSWSPDGQQIVFAATVNGTSQLFTLDVSTGEAQQITFGNQSSYLPSWSPDGLWIAYSQASPDGSRSDLMVSLTDGSVTETVASGEIVGPIWMPS